MENWYYIFDQKSIGPLAETEFLKLVRQGVIQNKTLVWNPGFAFDWVEFGSVSPESFSTETAREMLKKSEEKQSNGEEKPEASVPCDDCGKLFKPDELIRREDFKVCADCNKHFNHKYLNALKSTRASRCAECGKLVSQNELFACVRAAGGIHPAFELLAPVPLSLVCFRWNDGRRSEEELTAFNRQLLDRVNASGRVFLTHTTLRDKFTIRLVVGQRTTEERHVRLAWELLTRESERLA